MPTLAVRDPNDPRLRPFAQLTRRGRSESIVIEGEIAVARALSSAHELDALLVTPGHRVRLGAAIPESLPVYEAPAALLRQVVGFDFHRGCLAVMPRPAPASLASVSAALGPGPWTVVVAEGLADPANLGAVIRNARAFGAALVLHGRGADPWSRRAIRASMGLVFTLPVLGGLDLAEAVDHLERSAGARSVAAVVQPGARPLADYRAPSRLVLMVGNEGQGLSAELRERADDAVTIPLAQGVDSLNVAAATAVLLWAMRPSAAWPGDHR